MTQKRRYPRIFAIASILMGVVMMAWLGGLLAFTQSVSKIQPSGPLKKLDAIVVLTGGSNRIDAGFDLLEKGVAKKLFISGVYRGTEAKQLLKRWKTEPQSSLDCCVVLGFEADNTVGNARETVEWLKKEGFKSFYLVTANYHINRALLEFNGLAPELEITPYPVVPDQINMTNWWENITTRKIILREYTKYIAAYTLHSF